MTASSDLDDDTNHPEQERCITDKVREEWEDSKDGTLEICWELLEWHNGEITPADFLWTSGDGMDGSGWA